MFFFGKEDGDLCYIYICICVNIYVNMHFCLAGHAVVFVFCI